MLLLHAHDLSLMLLLELLNFLLKLVYSVLERLDLGLGLFGLHVAEAEVPDLFGGGCPAGCKRVQLYLPYEILRVLVVVVLLERLAHVWEYLPSRLAAGTASGFHS